MTKTMQEALMAGTASNLLFEIEVRRDERIKVLREFATELDQPAAAGYPEKAQEVCEVIAAIMRARADALEAGK